MTIAAGFHVSEGVLLCADTMYSSSMKVHQEKVFVHLCQGCRLVFALAGHEGYAKMAIEDCVDAVNSMDRNTIGWPSVKASLRGVVKLVKEEYVDQRPIDEREGAKFDLLIAVWLPGWNRPKLLATSDSAIISVDSYECLGSGSYLARYIVGPSYTHQMAGHLALLLAVRALAETKKHDMGCGGNSSFTLVTNHGQIVSLGEYPVWEMEKFLSVFDGSMNRVRSAFLQVGLSEEQLDSEFDLFRREIKKNWNALKSSPGTGFLFSDHAAMDRLIQSVSPFPQSTTDDQCSACSY